jgi:hypothetical protein
MSTFEISNENVIMASFNDVPEEVCKAFEECKKAIEEKEMQELLACYARDRRCSITQIKELVLPPINSTKEVHTAKVSHPSTSVTPKDVSAMFSENVKLTRNMVGDEVAKGLVKFSQNSKYQPTTFATTYPTTTSPSATPSTSATQLLEYGRVLKIGLGIWGLVLLATRSIKNRIRVSSIRLHIPRGGVSQILLNLMARVLAPCGNM